MSDGVLRYGQPSTEVVDRAAGNFAGAALNALSLCCTPIELLSNDDKDTIIARASGFFWLHNNEPHLVSSWHVVSGRNPFTNTIISENGYIPRKLRFYGRNFHVEHGKVFFKQLSRTLLFDECLTEQFSEPPKLDGKPVDIWAIPISEQILFRKDNTRSGFAGASGCSCFVNELTGKPIVSQSGDDCFILGYPLGNYDGMMLPIWKRGSIASETNMGANDNPLFFIDSAVTPSMSGSPIFRKATLFTADNRDIGALQEFVTYDLIGVYGGRLRSAELERTNLGYGWYKSIIDFVIESYNFKCVKIPS